MTLPSAPSSTPADSQSANSIGFIQNGPRCGKESTAGRGVKDGADRIAEEASEDDGALNRDRAELSRPRAAPPLPKAPNPPSDVDGEAPSPDFGKKPASGVEKAAPGATVGSKRRPGSPSNPLGGATGFTNGLTAGALARADAAAGPVELENPSPPAPASPEPDCDDGPLKEKVPPEESPRPLLNQVRWSASGARISEMDRLGAVSPETSPPRVDSRTPDRDGRPSLRPSSAPSLAPLRDGV